MEIYDYGHIGFICSMIGMGIILMSYGEFIYIPTILSYVSWYISGGMQLMTNRYNGHNEATGKFLLTLANLCLFMDIIEKNQILGGRKHTPLYFRLIYLLTYLILFGKYCIELA